MTEEKKIGLNCKRCGEDVTVNIAWYGVGWIYRCHCSCTKINDFNGSGSYLEGLNFAKRLCKHWEDL